MFLLISLISNNCMQLAPTYLLFTQFKAIVNLAQPTNVKNCGVDSNAHFFWEVSWLVLQHLCIFFTSDKNVAPLVFISKLGWKMCGDLLEAFWFCTMSTRDSHLDCNDKFVINDDSINSGECQGGGNEAEWKWMHLHVL